MSPKEKGLGASSRRLEQLVCAKFAPGVKDPTAAGVAKRRIVTRAAPEVVEPTSTHMGPARHGSSGHQAPTSRPRNSCSTNWTWVNPERVGTKSSGTARSQGVMPIGAATSWIFAPLAAMARSKFSRERGMW